MNALHVVTAEVRADCPFSMAQEYAEAFLRNEQAWPVVRRGVKLTFELRGDAAECGRAHDEIGVRWKAGTPWLPDVCATVRFRIAGGGTLVRVDDAYRVPLGKLGELFDALAGSQLARANAMHLAARIAGYLEAQQRTWRAAAIEAMAG